MARILAKAEKDLEAIRHPDPYISEPLNSCTSSPVTSLRVNQTAPTFPGGTKWYVSMSIIGDQIILTYSNRERNTPVSVVVLFLNVVY